MKPTNKLRFVEREIEVNGDHKPVRILQQWWKNNSIMLIIMRLGHAGMPENVVKGEWRDVPLETE